VSEKDGRSLCPVLNENAGLQAEASAELIMRWTRSLTWRIMRTEPAICSHRSTAGWPKGSIAPVPENAEALLDRLE
jgi:hypothetical protein